MNNRDCVERLQNTGNEFLTKQKYLSNKIVSGHCCSLKSIFFQTEVAFQVVFDQIVTAKPDNKSIVRCLVLSHSSFFSIFVLISKLYTKWNHKITFKHKIFYHYVYSRYMKTKLSSHDFIRWSFLLNAKRFYSIPIIYYLFQLWGNNNLVHLFKNSLGGPSLFWDLGA